MTKLPSFERIRAAFYAEFRAEAALRDCEDDSRMSSDEDSIVLRNNLRNRQIERNAIWDLIEAAVNESR